MIRNSRYETIPTFKESSLGLPLSHSSEHAPHVHGTWPVALLKSMCRKASTEHGEILVRNVLVGKFVGNLAHPTIVERIRTASFNAPPRRTRGVHRCKTLWIVLPYHSLWYKDLMKSTRIFSSSIEWRAMYSAAFGSECPDIRIAWRSAGQNVAQRLRNA